jgi:hypothetical protein
MLSTTLCMLASSETPCDHMKMQTKILVNTQG